MFLEIRRNLKHGKKYQLGRESSGSDNEFFIQCNVNRQYISKKHLTIEVIANDMNETKTVSALKITFESKASTVVNNEKFKLRSNQAPFAKEFKENVIIEFKEKNERVNIQWVPFNVLKGEASQFLVEAFSLGLDVHVTSVPQLANAAVVEERNIPNTIATHAMIYNLPMMTVEWLKYISEKNVDIFHPDLTSKFMFRNNYADTTGILFNGFIFHSGDLRDELKKFIELNGGIFVKTNFDLLDSTLDFQSFLDEKFVHRQDKCLILQPNPNSKIKEFAETYNATVINDQDLFIAVKENSVELFKPVTFHNKRPALSEEPELIVNPSQKDSIASQSQWRKRKKVKKVDALAFLMPSQATKPVSNSETDTETNQTVAAALENCLNAEVNRDTDLTSSNKVATDGKDDVSICNNRKRDGEQHEEVPSKRKKFKANEILEVEDLEYIPETKLEKPQHQVQALKKEADDSSNKPELISAISTAKDHLSETIKKELDTDTFIPQYHGQTLESYVEEKLGSLAIVETVDIKPRKQVNPLNSDKALYQGRKNFKKFRKNMLVKSFVTRTFIELQSPEHQNAIKKLDLLKAQKQSDKILEDLRIQAENQTTLSQDSMEEESQGLFVKDSQEDVDSPPNDYNITTTKDSPFLEDDDERDDDDMPRFSFTGE